jgi:hypothetical protein
MKARSVRGGPKHQHSCLVEALENVAAQVLAAREKRGQSLADRIVSREEFQALRHGVNVSEEDIRILLRFLERDKQVQSYSAKVCDPMHVVVARMLD